MESWVDQVWKAADRPEIAAAVGELYERVQREIELQKPRCEFSGRCCNFEAYGHRMYITAIELAVFAGRVRGVVGNSRDMAQLQLMDQNPDPDPPDSTSLTAGPEYREREKEWNGVG